MHTPMTRAARLLVALLCAALPPAAAAQDGLVVNGHHFSAALRFGADLGPAPSDWSLPLAGGGRYSVDDHLVRDRRSGLTITVPAEALVLAIDPVRPRVFIRFDNNVTGTIAEFDLTTASSRPLITVAGAQARWADRVRYAYSADRLFVDVTDGTEGGPGVEAPHPIRVFDGTTGRQVGAFTVTTTTANASYFTNPWIVTPDGTRAYFGAISSGFFGAGFVKVVQTADGTTSRFDLRATRLHWDDVNRRLFVYDGALLHLLSADLAPLGSAPLDIVHDLQISPHTGRLYVASGQFHRTYGGDIHLAVFDSGAFAPLGAANLGNARGFSMTLVSAPGAPRTFSATATGHDVTLDWTNVGAASHFVLDVGVAPGRTDASVFLGASTHVIFAHVPSGTYYLRLRGGNEFGGGRPSQEVQVVVP